MYGMAFGRSAVKIVLELAHGEGLADAYTLALLTNGGLDTHPDDAIDGELVAKDNLAVLIDVDDGGKTGIIGAKEIEERRVLTIVIGVVGIVHATLVVAEEEQQATLQRVFQLLTATDISFFCKHNGLYLGVYTIRSFQSSGYIHQYISWLCCFRHRYWLPYVQPRGSAGHTHPR